jgi:hypothetical protein
MRLVHPDSWMVAAAAAAAMVVTVVVEQTVARWRNH